MVRPEGIPAPVVRRLSLYLRHLESVRAEDRPTVSSRELSRALGITDTQVRKDLAHFGQFGQRGIGYRVAGLVTRMRQILGTDRLWNVILIGAGNLGSALMRYRGFKRKNFRIVAVLDNDTARIGTAVPGLALDTIQPITALREIVRQYDVKMAISAVPAEAAQSIVDQLAEAGIRGILNFAPVILQPVPGVRIETVDLAVLLEQLTFQLNIGTGA